MSHRPFFAALLFLVFGPFVFLLLVAIVIMVDGSAVLVSL